MRGRVFQFLWRNLCLLEQVFGRQAGLPAGLCNGLDKRYGRRCRPCGQRGQQGAGKRSLGLWRHARECAAKLA